MTEELVPLMPNPIPINEEDAAVLRFLEWLESMGVADE